MVCPSCGTTFEGRFCPNCGADIQTPPPAPTPPSYVCVRCGAMFGGPSCPFCGTPVGGWTDEAEGARALGSVLWSVSIVAFFVLLIANLVALAFAAQLVIAGALTGGPRPIWLFVLTPLPWGPIVDASAEAFLGYFALVLFGILATYAWFAVRDAKPTVAAFTRPIGDLRSRLESTSAWVATGQVFLAVLFFTFTYALLLEFVGFTPTQPPLTGGSFPEWYQYFALANASVYEELVSRLLLIGVPLAIAAPFLESAGTPPGAAPRSALRHLLGGTLNRDSPQGMVIFAAAWVVISATVFGVAHVPGYGLWKFLPTFVGGLGMGYLFVRRGLLAGILFHFATDYLVALILLTSDHLGAQLILGVFVLLLIGLGLFFFVWYFFYISELLQHFLVAWGYRVPALAVVSAAPGGPPSARPVYPNPPTFGAPPGYGPSPPNVPLRPRAGRSPAFPGTASGWIGYACPRCGGLEARYDAGRFTCLRCGHVT